MSNPVIRPYQEGNISSPSDRSQVMRRDNDLVKVPKITLFDIDYAIYYHLTENIKVRVDDNNTTIQVPVQFANGEKWSQIRQYGYLRGDDKKVLAPLISIRRTSVQNDDRLPMNRSNISSPSYKLFPYKNLGMQYDRVSGQYLKKDSIEYYLVAFPEYVRIAYDLIIWTDLQEQMNQVIHSILTTNDHVWGDINTFRTNIQDVSHDNVNVPGEDRLVKTTMTLQVDGQLRPEYQYNQSRMQKQYSIKTVRFLEEGSEKIIFDSVDKFPDVNSSGREISTQNKDTIKEESANMRKTIRR